MVDSSWEPENLLGDEMAVNAGPLTTAFVPPESCVQTLTSAGGVLFRGHFGVYNTAATGCLPPTTRSVDFARQEAYFSPGLCPSDWVAACTYSAAGLPVSATASVCCPV